MAKRFKLKISRILSFKSCRSNDPSSLPVAPSAVFDLRSAPTKSHRRSSFKRHVSSAFGCGLGRRNLSGVDTEASRSPPPTPRFHWEREGKWHVIARVHDEEEEPRRKIYEGKLNDGVLASRPREVKRQRVKKKTARRARLSTSSAEESEILFTENENGEEDAESLIPSSRSLSAEDSSLELPRGTRRKNKRKPQKRCVSRRRNSARAEAEASQARLSTSLVRRFVPCAAAEAVAVVKRSEDPYEDFKGSMVEMIVEKKMFDAAELEQLLRCFLTLNSRRHHGAIVRAFSEIWVALFSGGRRSSCVRLSDYMNVN